MLQSLLRWTWVGLRKLPFARKVYQAWRYYALCQRPYTGPRERLEARLGDLERVVGRDRFPHGTSISDLAGWLDDLNAAPTRTPAVPPRRILLFNTMTHWVRFSVPIFTRSELRANTSPP